MSGDHKPIILSLSVRQGGILNMNWNFKEYQEVEKQF